MVSLRSVFSAGRQEQFFRAPSAGSNQHRPIVAAVACILASLAIVLQSCGGPRFVHENDSCGEPKTIKVAGAPLLLGSTPTSEQRPQNWHPSRQDSFARPLDCSTTLSNKALPPFIVLFVLWRGLGKPTKGRNIDPYVSGDGHANKMTQHGTGHHPVMGVRALPTYFALCVVVPRYSFHVCFSPAAAGHYYLGEKERRNRMAVTTRDNSACCFHVATK
jgi:hypothetical protein